jgi:hypothetical protein
VPLGPSRTGVGGEWNADGGVEGGGGGRRPRLEREGRREKERREKEEMLTRFKISISRTNWIGVIDMTDGYVMKDSWVDNHAIAGDVTQSCQENRRDSRRRGTILTFGHAPASCNLPV